MTVSPPSHKPFKYWPLSENLFRLLTLDGGAPDSPLRANISDKPLFIADTPSSDLPYYEALSYTWGKPIFQEHITVSADTYSPIRENLAAALRRLRLPDRSR